MDYFCKRNNFLCKGANLALTDNNGLTALDHILVDRPQHVAYSLQAPLEVSIGCLYCPV